MGRTLSLGFEAGWRWSDLEGLNEFDGAFIGGRVGLLLGRGE